MDSAEKTLISIASASQRVVDALLVRSRGRNDKNLQLSHKQLEGDLQRIVVASKILLPETLGHSFSADPAVDDRLEMWLSGEEPQTCLATLQEMEASIKPSSSGVASKLRNLKFRPSALVEDKFNQAIRIFEKKRIHFYFLLNTNVWNRENDTMGQPKGHSIHTQSTRRGLVDRGKNVVERSWKKKIWSETDRERLTEIVEWLGAWDCTKKHWDTLDLRQPDTCTWLPETDEYQTWRYANDGFLWLHGKPGSGKSVLAASVIDGIQNTMDQVEFLAFFYCDFRSERSTVAAEVMRSLLSQLLEGLGDHGVDPGDILDVLGKEKRQKHTILGEHKRLAALVSRVAKQYPRPPLVVVDALDECEDIENLLGSLVHLYKGGVRLLVISRPLQGIKSRFSGLPWLSLEQMSREVYADIGLHVRREVDSHSRLRDAGTMLKEEIIERLCREADGMFRWIECQLITLKRCFTTLQIREAFDSLPIGLDATYQRILLAVSKEERGGVIAKRALMWIVTAQRPLRLCQILEALSIDVDQRTLNPNSAPIHGGALLDSLSSLVIHSEGDIVELSHFSVKEYLIGNLLQENHMYHINLPDAHAEVAQQCMSYIAAFLTLRLQVSNDHPLLDYAMDYGFYHLHHVEPTDRILDSILALHRDIQQHPLEWERLRKGSRAYKVPSHQHDFVLYILIRYARDPLLRLFLCRSPLAEKEGINPLIYIAPWNIEAARTLLAHGAKLGFSGQFIETHDFPSGLPIEAAAKAGDWDLVDLFLEEGSPVPHRLFSAHLFGRRSQWEHPYDSHIFTRLLQADEFMEWAIDVHNARLLIPVLHANLLDWQNSAAGDVVVIVRRLKQISCNLAGHTSFVDALLQNAASTGDISSIQHVLSDLKMQLPPDILVNRRSFSCVLPNAETIRFLIQNGANIHVVSADESTALHYAVRVVIGGGLQSCLQKTKLLCEAGCSPSVCNLQGETPMHIAIKESGGDLSIVTHLLSVTGALLPPDIFFSVRNSLSPSMIRFLLGEGADARVVAANGNSVLHSALRYTSTDDSAAHMLESIKMLVAAGCDLHITNSSGQTCLDIAAAQGHISVVIYLLSLNTPHSPDIFLSALGWRSYHDWAEYPVMAKLLLKHGADPNVKTPEGDNALHLAMDRGRQDERYLFPVVKTLVEAGCDPSVCDSHGRSVLVAAADNGYMKIMEYLFSQGANIPPNILLFLSYHRTTTQVIQLLIDKGADVRAVTADGDTPLYLAVLSVPESSSLKFAELLISAGSDPRAFSVAHETPMHAAVKRGYISVIKYLLSLSVPLPPDILLTVQANSHFDTTPITPVVCFLIDKGADTTAITAEGETALHIALGDSFRAGSDLLETAKILIVRARCDIHACNSAGHTPLYAAASCGHLDIIKFLLSRGASVSPDVFLAAATYGDIGIMEYLLTLEGTSVPPSAFLAAASCTRDTHQARAVRFLSTLDGADVRVVALNGETALHRAVKLGHSEDDCLETAKLLVHLGCHLSLCDSTGETPLHITARRHHISVFKYLRSEGVPLPSDVLLSVVSECCWRPKAGAMVRLLIREGANPCVANDEEDTPLHVLLRDDFYGAMEEWKVVQMLLDAGANPRARNLDGQTPVDLSEKKGPFFANNFMRLVEQVKAPIVP